MGVGGGEISEKGGTARVLTFARRYGTADVFRLKSALSGSASAASWPAVVRRGNV